MGSWEDGTRATKGWFKVVAPHDDNENTFSEYQGKTFTVGKDNDAIEENERWYYADGDGQLYAGVIKKIKGKYYDFYPEGTGKATSMLTGLCALRVKNGEILEVVERNMDADDLEDCMDGDGKYSRMYETNRDEYSLYYFGNDEDHDGAMKIGNVTINLDGSNYQFKFSKIGGAEGKGKGLTGIDDKKYIYKFGMKMKADSDDKYKRVEYHVQRAIVEITKRSNKRELVTSSYSIINK